MVTLTLALLHRQLLDIPRKSLFSPNPNTSPNLNCVHPKNSVCFLVSSKVRLEKDVFRSTLLIRPAYIKVSDLSHFLCLSLPLLQTDQSSRRTRTWSSADYEEAFHYSPKRTYTGAIYEYCQRQNTLPSFALIPGPIGGERLFTVQLHLNGLRTIGLARTVKAARHRSSENTIQRMSFRACAFVKNLYTCAIKKAGLACSVRGCVQKADTGEYRADVHSNLEKIVFFRFLSYNESGLGSAKCGSAKTISRLTRSRQGLFQQVPTLFDRLACIGSHALALVRDGFEKASASWRACRILGMKMIFTGVRACMTRRFHSSHTKLRNIFNTSPQTKTNTPNHTGNPTVTFIQNLFPKSNVDFREFVELRAGSLIRFFSFRLPKQ